MSVRPHGTLRPLDGFNEIWYLSIFRKFVEKIQVSLKSDKLNGYFDNNLSTFMVISRSIPLRMRNAADKSHRENHNTSFTFNKLFFRTSCRLWDNVEKYGTSRQATDDNTAHAHCLLDTYGYKHKLITCNTYYFSTATMIARTHFNVRLISKFPVLIVRHHPVRDEVFTSITMTGVVFCNGRHIVR
jgi:hypothetical protein